MGFVETLEEPPRTGDFGRSASISTRRDVVAGCVSEYTTESVDGGFT